MYQIECHRFHHLNILILNLNANYYRMKNSIIFLIQEKVRFSFHFFSHLIGVRLHVRGFAMENFVFLWNFLMKWSKNPLSEFSRIPQCFSHPRKPLKSLPLSNKNVKTSVPHFWTSPTFNVICLETSYFAQYTLLVLWYIYLYYVLHDWLTWCLRVFIRLFVYRFIPKGVGGKLYSTATKFCAVFFMNFAF